MPPQINNTLPSDANVAALTPVEEMGPAEKSLQLDACVTTALQYSLRSGVATPPASLFLLRIALAILGLLFV